MSVRFVVADAAGRILRSGSCPRRMLAAQAGPDEQVVEGVGGDGSHRVEGGRIVPGALPPPADAPQPMADEEVAARRYLASTDWMAARLAETGKPIPADVAAKRAEARETINRARDRK